MGQHLKGDSAPWQRVPFKQAATEWGRPPTTPSRTLRLTALCALEILMTTTQSELTPPALHQVMMSMERIHTRAFAKWPLAVIISREWTRAAAACGHTGWKQCARQLAEICFKGAHWGNSWVSDSFECQEIYVLSQNLFGNKSWPLLKI